MRPDTTTTSLVQAASGLSPEAARLLALIARQRPRVHCLTNTVAQNLTANVLLALGADVSMAMHPAELEAMLAGAGAVLVNLGTMDLGREVAIDGILGMKSALAVPVVIDPVFADLSPLRLGLAMRLMQLPNVILKGNVREMAVLAPLCPPHVTRITTGAVDDLAGPGGAARIDDGHEMMARVVGTGCAAGAVIAAFAAVGDEPGRSAAAAMGVYNLAGRIAASRSEGPGSFTPHFLDTLTALSTEATELAA